MASTESVSGGPCRFCGADLKFEFVDLGMTPLCETFLTKAQLNHMERYYPLRVYVCDRCFLVQLQEYVSPQEIFSSEYPYFASYSDSWLRHAKAYTDLVTDRFNLSSRSQVVEIASNDGYLLQYFMERGIPVLGVEPARNVARVAIENGIPTVVKFFGCDTARELLGSGKQADLLLGNNVLAHVPQLNDFVEGLKILLKPTGVITMEFPHLAQLIAKNQFDTMYHEHFSYLSFHTVEKVFAAHGLTLFDVDELPSHGGSLRIYARHTQDTSRPISKKVLELRMQEEIAGLTTLEPYASFSEQVPVTKRKLLTFLIDAKGAGKSIVGYGAPGKGNTLLNYCGIRTDFLEYVVDRNPVKHGKYTPGTHIPIYPVERIRETKPDYVLILPWNLKKEVMAQLNYIQEWGGAFVVPIPEVTVVRNVDQEISTGDRMSER